MFTIMRSFRRGRIRFSSPLCPGCGRGCGCATWGQAPDFWAFFCCSVELQESAVRLAERAAAENCLTDCLFPLHGDLRQIRSLLGTGSFDLVVSNPPYYVPGSGALAAEGLRQSARAEVCCTLEEVCQAAAYLLRWGGSFCVVHKPERLTDLLCTLRECHLEPKRLRFVCKTAEAAPSLVLCESRRGGKPGLSIEPPLLLRTAAGTPTPEVDAIYFRQQEELP